MIYKSYEAFTAAIAADEKISKLCRESGYDCQAFVAELLPNIMQFGEDGNIEPFNNIAEPHDTVTVFSGEKAFSHGTVSLSCSVLLHDGDEAAYMLDDIGIYHHH